MSYILDALKRADTERERGAAPHLLTRHDLPSGTPASSGTGRQVSLMAVGLLIFGLIATGIWFWQVPAKPARITEMMPPVTARASVAPPMPALPATPPTTPSSSTLARVAPQPTAPVTAIPASAPTPPRPTLTMELPKKPVDSAVVLTPALNVPSLSELPEDLRRQLPKLTITGSVFSNTPSQRLLLLNNLVLTPGSQVAPGLTLEEIETRSSVFNFNGTRFRVAN